MGFDYFKRPFDHFSVPFERYSFKIVGADGELLALGEEYIAVIALGASTQVIGTGLVPFIRNHDGSFYAMVSMIMGFVTNIILDYLFVWILGQSVSGAAWATVIGQGVTMLFALAWLLRKKAIYAEHSSIQIWRGGCVHTENRDCPLWAYDVP